MMARAHRPVTARSMAKRIDAAPVAVRALIRWRLSTLLEVFEKPGDGTTAEQLERVGDIIGQGDRAAMWLALAVIAGALPTEPEVLRACRRADLDGPFSALGDAIDSVTSTADNVDVIQVEIVTDRVVVDVAQPPTSEAASLGGGPIEAERAEGHAVAALTEQWLGRDDTVALHWSRSDRAWHRAPGAGAAAEGEVEAPIVVPWRCTVILPAPLRDATKGERLLALARFSQNRTGAVVYDAFPADPFIAKADPSAATFANALAALSHFDRVAAISHALAVELGGWRRMLSGAGIEGPDIAAVPLPILRRPPAGRASIAHHTFDDAERSGIGGDAAMVLVVGSTGSQDNFGAVLAAAEHVWRSGVAFRLVLVGAPESGPVAQALERAVSLQRDVRRLDTLSEGGLGAAYDAARCSVFVSLHEPYAWPVADSIVSGTPVITSHFASMRELGEPGGAVLVDPRDDGQIADALRRLLTDDAWHDDLARQAHDRAIGSFEDYANAAFSYLVEGAQPPSL